MSSGAATARDDAAELVIRLGRALHAFGTSSHRLEAALERVSRHLGLEGQFFSTPTAIFASFGGGAKSETVLVRAEPGGMDLARLQEVEGLLSDLLAGRCEPRQVSARLDQVIAGPPRYGPVLTTLAFGLASGSAARFFGAGPREIAAAALVGLGIGLLGLLVAGRSNLSRLFEPLSACFAALFAGFAATWLAPFAGSIDAATVVLAGLIVLFPGLTLTLAMSELAARHLVSGSARLAGAVITFLGIGFGVAVGQHAAHALFGPAPAGAPLPLPGWTEAPALLGTALAFVVLFRARGRDLPWILLGALVALFGGRLGTELLGSELAAFVGAFLLGAVANTFRRALDRPAAVVQVPGMMLLVPGSLGFRSISSLLAQDPTAGIQAAFSMTLVAVSLVMGLLMATVLFAPRRLL